MDEIKWYCANDKMETRFYKLSKVLFENNEYSKKLSLAAKVLYCFLVNRISLSIKNDFIDKDNKVYIMFTRQEASELLGITEKSVRCAFKELENMDLIYEKRRGQGKANVIYVGKLNALKLKSPRVQTGKIYRSKPVKITALDRKNLPGTNTNINKTDINKTNQSEKGIEVFMLKDIKLKAKLNEFNDDEKEILEVIIDKLYYTKILKVDNKDIINEVILEKLKSLTKENLLTVLEVLYNKRDLKNKIGYGIKVLYNSLGCKNINLKRYKGREYTAEDFEALYDN